MAEPIIDNRDVSMHDSLTRRCMGADTLDIAVGYFHVSGFNKLRQSLAGIKKIRLIMGDETDETTAKQLRKGHDPREAISERIVEMLNNTMDSETSDTLMELYEYIKSGKMQVRLYVRSKFHAKTYILRSIYKGVPNESAFIGSSNLSNAGLGYESGNIELNFLATAMEHVKPLSTWYETIWNESVEYSEDLIRIMKNTEPYARIQNDKEYVTPRELFKIMASELLDTNVESSDDMLAEFQKIGVINAQDKIDKYGGAIIADSVGLGKTYMGMELIRQAQEDGRNVLVIVPASVESNWKRELGNMKGINHDESRLQILTIEKLSRIDLGHDSGRSKWRDLHKYDYMVVDEAHRFKKHGSYADGQYSGTKSHANLTALRTRRDVPCVLLTATPLSNTVSDLKYLINIFTNESKLKKYNSDLDSSHFDEYRKLEAQIKKLQKKEGRPDGVVYKSQREEIEELKRQQRPHIDGIISILEEVMILRTRSDIGSRYPDLTINGKPVSFRQTVLRHERCKFPDEYIPLYKGVEKLLGRLTLPHISMREGSSPQSRGLYLILLYQRLDSSIHSFVASIEKLLAGDRQLLELTESVGWKKAVGEMELDNLGLDEYMLSQDGDGSYSDEEAITALCNDIELVEKFIHAKVKPVRTGTARYVDPKKDMLQKILDKEPGKVLVFTQYVDTAKYLYDLVSVSGRTVDCVTGQGDAGTDLDTNMKTKLFAPVANGYTLGPGEQEIVLSGK